MGVWVGDGLGAAEGGKKHEISAATFGGHFYPPPHKQSLRRLHVHRCLSTGGLHPGGLCPGGSLSGGSLSRGVSVQRASLSGGISAQGVSV